jgi:hypothetical protein
MSPRIRGTVDAGVVVADAVPDVVPDVVAGAAVGCGPGFGRAGVFWAYHGCR